MKKLMVLIFILGVSMILTFTKSYSQVVIIGPFSVVRDDAHKRYLVSDDYDSKIKQIGDNGTISVFSDASIYFSVPRGLAIFNNYLYVADENLIRKLDLQTGKQADSFDIGLNTVGLACDGSKYLYISDDGLNRIYQMNLSTYNTTNFIIKGLKAPHGLFYDSTNNRLLICPDTTTQPIRSANLSTKALTALTDSTYNYLEGIVGDGKGNYFVSEWADQFGSGSGEILYFNNGFTKPPVVFLNNLDGPSDICFNKKNDTLAIPLMSGNPSMLFRNTNIDFIPPVVDTAFAVTSTSVNVIFSKAVNAVSATTKANYTGLGTIASADLSSSSDTVTLTLSTALVKGTPKTLTISNVGNLAKIPMNASQQFQITFNGTMDIAGYTFKNFSIFPNPASDHFIVNYTMQENAFTSITLYDMRGKLIRKYLSQQQNPGSYNYVFSTDINPGSYLLEIKCNNESHTTPLFIIK